MRTVLMMAALALGMAVPAAAQHERDEAAIRAIVAEQVTAWNAGDGAANASRVSGVVHEPLRDGDVRPRALRDPPCRDPRHFYKGTTKHHAVRRIRFVSPDVALVDIDNEVRGVRAMPGGIAVPADGVLKTQLLEVFARRQGTWWIEAYHNVDVKPAK